jgi:DNA-binding NarL/FixJ family response regulator
MSGQTDLKLSEGTHGATAMLAKSVGGQILAESSPSDFAFTPDPRKFMASPFEAPPAAPTRVLLVGDHPATREGLRSVIKVQPDLAIAGEASAGFAASELAASLRPDVMLLDLNLPDGSGWSLIEQMRQGGCLPPTLVLSDCDELVYAPRLLRAGARGYLMKTASLDRILEAIRLVGAGHLAASPVVTSMLMARGLEIRDPLARKPGQAAPSELSDRELQVFDLLGRGLRNKEVAGQLRLSQKTVATYKVRIMEKLGLRHTPDLLARYQAWRGAPPAPVDQSRTGL